MVTKASASKRRPGSGVSKSGARAKVATKAGAKSSKNLQPRLSGSAIEEGRAVLDTASIQKFTQLRDGRSSVIIFAREYAEAKEFARRVALGTSDWFFITDPSATRGLDPRDIVIVSLQGWYLGREYRTRDDDLRWEAYKILIERFKGYQVEREYHMLGDIEVCLGKKKQ